MTEALEFARTIHGRHILYEGLGVFWLAAEACILLGVVSARRFLTRPGHRRLQVRPKDFAGLALFLLLLVVVVGRHGVYSFGYVSSSHFASPEGGAAAVFGAAIREHLAVWSAFVAGWVVLEILIVYQGWRSYHLLRKRLAVPSRIGVGALPILAFGLATAALAFGSASVLASIGSASAPASHGAALPLDTLEAAYAAQTPYHNAVYLLLRTAGLVWILVEWVAAVYLWRGYRLLAAAERRAIHHAR